jgi:hypothetical protein
MARVIFSTLCLLLIGGVGQSQQRQEVTKQERELILKVAGSADSSGPILSLFSEAYKIRKKVLQETTGPTLAYKAAVSFAKKWVQASESFAMAGGIVAGILVPSDLADNALDTNTDQPVFKQEPQPSKPELPQRTLNVTTWCTDSRGNTVPCKP